jgi:hypothetical protein
MTIFKSGALSIFAKGREVVETGDKPWVPAVVPAAKSNSAPVEPAPGAPWVPPARPAPSSEKHDPEIAKPAPPAAAWVPPARPAAKETPAGGYAGRPRLVFAVDATSSRADGWEAKKKLTDRFLAAMPAELDVALAFHGGNKVHTFTRFLPDAASLRKVAAGVRCRAGYTRLLDILARVLKEDRVGVVVYIGDVFEESERKALRQADQMRRKETRVIILHDTSSRDFDDGEVFNAIAERTGGAVLPFNPSSIERLGELLEAVAVLAVGGVEAVEEKQATMPAATVLLENLDPKRLLIGKG